jgi:hypothetical protein
MKSFVYTKVLGKDGLPKVAEIAFAALDDEARAPSGDRRQLVARHQRPIPLLGRMARAPRRTWRGCGRRATSPSSFMHMACPRAVHRSWQVSSGGLMSDDSAMRC